MQPGPVMAATEMSDRSHSARSAEAAKVVCAGSVEQLGYRIGGTQPPVAAGVSTARTVVFPQLNATRSAPGCHARQRERLGTLVAD